jgi:hypothetical protein
MTRGAGGAVEAVEAMQASAMESVSTIAPGGVTAGAHAAAEPEPGTPHDRIPAVGGPSVPEIPVPRRRKSPAQSRTARERRTVTKLVRLSPAETRRVERRARECGRPVACFLREAALAGAPRARRTAAVDPVLAELVQLGTTLRRLRDRHRIELTEDAIRATLDTALAAVLDTIRRVECGAGDDVACGAGDDAEPVR